MSDNLPQVPQHAPPPTGELAPWPSNYADPFGSEDESEGISWRRYVAALTRQKWLIGLMFLLGLGASAALWIFIDPEYEAQVTMWIDQPTDARARAQGPIRSAELLQNYAWVDLLKSAPVVAPVVRSEKLFVVPDDLADSVAVKDFDIGDEVWAGQYRISVDASGGRYVLSTAQGDVVEEGTVGDSVGRTLGFLWGPGSNVLSPGRRIDFTVISPTEAALRLATELIPNMQGPGSFLTLALRGKDPRRIARVVNAVAKEHVEVAEELKRKRADDLAAQLLQQRDRVYQDLQSAEFAYEQFRVNTITLPTDQQVITPGLQAANAPALDDFFNRQLRLDQIRQDRRRIEQAIAGGTVRVEALELIPSVQQSSQLMAARAELTQLNAEMRTLRYRYTEINPLVVAKRGEIETLSGQTIPALASAVLSGLSAEEATLSTEIQQASTELRQIPERTVQEERLRRNMDASVSLYTEINQRFEQARLAAASTVPDVRIWSEAAVPQFPIPDERLRLILVVLGGSLALGILGALLLDRMDPRVQYPEEVTAEMGLSILGAVPPIKRLDGKRGEENTEHVVEAFRELRLNLLYAYGNAGPGPLVITISSPGSGDGKSLITANLGVAFAELGRKTLIIDGDTRRGDIHQLLGTQRKPGLTDYLSGEASRSEIIQKTDYESLDVIASGSRLTHAPELLGSVEMRELFSDLRTQYGVILVDSPPLGAGSDAFMLGTLSGNMVLILRTGTTNKELTLARLTPLNRLPVRILGAILNDVQPGGVYRYYSSYLPGYGTGEEEGGRPPRAKRTALEPATTEVGKP